MHKKEIKNALRELTGKNNIYLTKRGNISIKESLKYVKSQNYTDVLVQDQGGWMTYPQFIKKLKLNLIYIKTNYGLITKDTNLTNTNNKSALLFNTMPGYAYLQDTNIIDEKINDIKNKNNQILIINDVAGSIGTQKAKWGDIIIGSFGRQKPINLEKGGFIATDLELNIEEEEFTKSEQDILLNKLNNLKTRLSFYENIHNKIIKDITTIHPELDIVHKDIAGINVIIKYQAQDTKELITDYCKNNNYEYTECPRYIRIIEPAISIEVKRLEE